MMAAGITLASIAEEDGKITMAIGSFAAVCLSLVLCCRRYGKEIGLTPEQLQIMLGFLTAGVLLFTSASGVAGGSLLLIPMACSLFGISSDISMQIVGVGFIIGVIQDSCETAINSSGDAIFAAAAEFRHWRKEGKEVDMSWKALNKNRKTKGDAHTDETEAA